MWTSSTIKRITMAVPRPLTYRFACTEQRTVWYFSGCSLGEDTLSSAGPPVYKLFLKLEPLCRSVIIKSNYMELLSKVTVSWGRGRSTCLLLTCRGWATSPVKETSICWWWTQTPVSLSVKWSWKDSDSTPEDDSRSVYDSNDEHNLDKGRLVVLDLSI